MALRHEQLIAVSSKAQGRCSSERGGDQVEESEEGEEEESLTFKPKQQMPPGQFTASTNTGGRLRKYRFRGSSSFYDEGDAD